MDNVRFNVGDKVIALNTNSGGQLRIEGKLYPVINICYCSKCGVQAINHTNESNGEAQRCGKCHFVDPNDGFWWSNSYHFALAQNMTAQIEEALEEPIKINL